jgi:hypothetical protein
MKVNRISLAALLVVVPVLCLGCDFGPPTPPVTPLTESQLKGVIECQETIKKDGAEFISDKLKNLEECLDDVLKLQLKSENGKISPADYTEGLSEVRSECSEKYKEIGQASTEFVNGVIRSCKPVASIILPTTGYDPLEFGYQGAKFSDVTHLAGGLCGEKEPGVDFLVAVEVPRMGDLLDTLGDSFHTSIGGTPDEEIPTIPLDSRCTSPVR